MRRFHHTPIVFLIGLVILFVGGIIPQSARAEAPGEKTENRHWKVDGVERVAHVIIPAEAHEHPTPIIFAFHGHNGTMEDAAKEFGLHRHWPSAIVVYPQGLRTPASNDPKGEQTGWQYHPGDDHDRDVKFFDAMLADFRKELKVNDQRVYAVGFSNGGGFAFVLWATRGDQISGVVSCEMTSPKGMISTLKPRPFMQIVGKKDTLQPVAAEEKTAMAVAKHNDCDPGQPWGKNPDCTIYPSKTGTPVVFMIHNGAHEVPKEAGRIAEFFQSQSETQTQPQPHSVVGTWHLNQPIVGESDLHITGTADKLEVQEVGQGGAKSTAATCENGLLTIHWQVNDDLRGYWVFNVNEDCTKGKGKTVFLRCPSGFEPGKAEEVEGKKVRVVDDATIERVAEK